MPKEIPYSDEEVVQAFAANRGNLRATARQLSISRGAIKYRLERAKREQGLAFEKPVSGGKLTATETIKMPLPKPGEVKRYVLTSAQNNTDAHVPFFENLVAYAEWCEADLKVARYPYNRGAYLRMNAGLDDPTDDDTKELWFDPIFDEYICDQRLELAPMLVFCGEVKILPTAKRPLSSFETYPSRASAIFPHAKFALESIAGTKDDGAKLNYTTGTATLMNYIQKKAGLQAEFHHSYGAVIAEVNSQGDWYVRQLNADEDGSFYDVTEGGAILIKDGEVMPAEVEAINWGDIHAEVVDREIYDLAFDADGILDTLRPAHQFAHDVLDFRARNHHEIKNCHQMFKRWREGSDDVRQELIRVKEVLEHIDRDFCMTVVVDSNHDNALERWLREGDYREDPDNAIFFLECQLDKYKALDAEDDDHHVMREALRREGLSMDILFLGPDDSFVLCDDGSGGVECGMHGHLGPNGARGTTLGLSRIGRKANTGHTHSAQIIDGLYVAGTMSRLRLDYNKGPSSWSHSFIVTYPNGKRTIVTCYNGDWIARP